MAQDAVATFMGGRSAGRGHVTHRRRTKGCRATAGRRPRVVRVAAFVSPSLRSLGRRIGFPLAVVATVADPVAHVARLNGEEHACWCLGEDWILDGVGVEESDPLPPAFEQLRFDPRWLGGRRPPSGIAVESGSLLVVLPRGVSGAGFGAALKARLSSRRLDVHGARPGRVLHRRMTGRPLVATPRYSRLPHAGDGATAFRLADDLYAFRPRNLPALAAAAVATREWFALAARPTWVGPGLPGS